MCVGEAATHGAKRPHAKEVLFDVLSLLPMGEEKNLKGMGWLLPMGLRDCIPKRTISCQLGMGRPLTDLYGSVVYL